MGGGASGVELSWRTQSHLHRILHQTQQPIQNLEIHLFQRDNAQYNSRREGRSRWRSLSKRSKPRCSVQVPNTQFLH